MTHAADALCDLIYDQADIDRSGGGALLMTPLPCATPFLLPDGVALEDGGSQG